MKSIFKYTVTILVGVSMYCNAQIVKSLNQFGAKGNGTTDDTEFVKNAMLAAQNGIILDGQNRTYLIAQNIDINLKSLNLINMKIITGKKYIKQSIKINSNNVTLDNISVDGGRNSYKKGYEKWNVFSKESDVESIYPDEPDLFYFVGLDQKASYNISNLTMNNIHAASAITIITYGNVNLKNLSFSNLSNKSFHVYHSIDEGKYRSGATTVTNAFARNVGLLSDQVMINNIVYRRDDVKAMPQASFNFIVSFGDFYLTKATVENYGSTGVTPDRNENFVAQEIVIRNSSQKGFSNNPSSALWFEECKNVKIDKVDISVSNRNQKDLQFNSSAMNIFGNNSNFEIKSVNITSSGDVLNKGLIGSFKGDNLVNIENLTINGNYKDKSLFFGNLDDGARVQVNIGQYTSNANNITFNNMQSVQIDNLQKSGTLDDIFFTLTNDQLQSPKYKILKTNALKINTSRNVKNLVLPSNTARTIVN